MSRLSFLVFLLFVGISCSNVSDKKLENRINLEIKKQILWIYQIIKIFNGIL